MSPRRGFVNVEALANGILEKSGIPRTPGGTAVDVETIVRDYCKIDIAQVPQLSLSGKPLSGAYAPVQKIIMVEATEGTRRKRFTIAHELGHDEIDYRLFVGESLFPVEAAVVFRCTSDDVRDLAPTSPIPNRSEILANKFAAYLLMPADLVREVWRKERDVYRCAELLEVSRESMGYRLEDLKLLVRDVG